LARRTPYTRLEKENQLRPNHVKGMGDVVFRGFQCLNPDCTNWLTVRADEVVEDFEVKCPNCNFIHRSGEEVEIYEYALRNIKIGAVVESGKFTVLMDDYIGETQLYKYCIVCCALKPLELFDLHSARRASRRQGECRLCKKTYNSIKNQTRIADQHREAAQKRRLYVEITGPTKIDSAAIRARFGGRCFKCGCDLTDPLNGRLDHTLPVSHLWPLMTDNATLLCEKDNGTKSGKWPSEYYTAEELKRLAVLTGIAHELLAGPPQVNPGALAQLKRKEFVDQMLAKYARYIDEIIKLRNRILRQAGFDFFSVTESISPAIVRRADELR
jgi:hypothetical protein